MTLRNVNYVKIQDMTANQRTDLGIKETSGLAAIETHNKEYKQKAVVIKKGLANYILHG